MYLRTLGPVHATRARALNPASAIAPPKAALWSSHNFQRGALYILQQQQHILPVARVHQRDYISVYRIASKT